MHTDLDPYGGAGCQRSQTLKTENEDVLSEEANSADRHFDLLLRY